MNKIEKNKHSEHEKTLEAVIDMPFKKLSILVSDLLKDNKELVVGKVRLESFGRNNNFIQYNFTVENDNDKIIGKYFLIIYPSPNNKSCIYTNFEEMVNLINEKILKENYQKLENGKENKKSKVSRKIWK